jgi:hypothetical protein
MEKEDEEELYKWDLQDLENMLSVAQFSKSLFSCLHLHFIINKIRFGYI